jgi:oligopeptide transport system substrate-binding protein
VLRLIAPILLLVACLGALLISDPPKPRADVVIVNRSEISTLDPATMSWAQDFRMARLVGEGLVRQDVFSANLKLIPGVASTWDIADHGREYRFRLRDDSKWADGSPVTARDFLESWRRNLLPETGADYVTLFKLIEGGARFHDFRKEQLKSYRAGDRSMARAKELLDEAYAFFDGHVGVRALSDNELIVRLERPVPAFLDMLAFPAFFPIHRESFSPFQSLDATSGELRTDARWMRPPFVVNNGPFIITDWTFKRGLRFQKNPFYPDRDRLNIDTIDCPTIEDPSAQVLAFTTGAADWVFDVSAPFRDEMLARREAFFAKHSDEVSAMRAKGVDEISIARALPPSPDSALHVFPAFGTYFYNINCAPRLPDGRVNPLADARIRRALAMSINKESVTRDIRRTGERPASVLIPPGSIPGYDAPAGLLRDCDAARKLLADAGFPNGQGFPLIEILFNKDGGHDVIAQAVAKDWEKELGIRVQLVMKETKVFRDDLKQGRYMISRASWFGDYGDPTTFLDINRSDDNNNDRNYESAAYDTLLDQAAETYADTHARMQLLQRAERMLVAEDAPLIPLFHYVELNLFDAHRLTGASTHPRQIQDLSRLDVLGDGKGADVPIAQPAPGGAP